MSDQPQLHPQTSRRLRAPGPPPYPRATMRLQFSANFTFADATRLVPYMSSLGISHLYASPILAARSGSTHGYDIVDHTRFNEEFGSEESFRELVRTLHAHGMGLILDFVPNHMGIGYDDNDWWLNVLEWGQNSPYASFFDIDWKPVEQSLRRKVLVPVLGDHYGAVLEQAELRLAFDPNYGAFSVHYYEHRFPIAPSHYSTILRKVADLLGQSGEENTGRREEVIRLAQAFESLGTGSSRAHQQALLIRRTEDYRGVLADLVGRDPTVRDALDQTIAAMNGTPGTPESFDELHKLLERQAYRLSYWRVASNEINYRRFFDINGLAAIRMEVPEVFEITHQLVFRLIQEGAVQGLRLDHVDGLLDPRAYLERLQEAAAYRILGSSGGERMSHGAQSGALDGDHTETERTQPVLSNNDRAGPYQLAAPDEVAYRAGLDQPLYVVVEKILAPHEQLRENWPVSGTTGYEFMNLVSGLFMDGSVEDQLTDIYEEFTGTERDFERVVQAAKYRTMQDTLASELNVLANQLNKLAKRSRRTRDFSRLALRSALSDIVARFPVYRTYADRDGVTDEGRRDIEWAVAKAKKAATTHDTSVYDFLQAVLTTDVLERYPGQFKKRDVVHLAMKVQQFTAPVMAKSVEDTAFYRDARFVARNEVGSDPERMYTPVSGFHMANRSRLDSWPFAMLSTATHDHKRGEDVRARLAAITEMPEAWREWAFRVAELADAYTTETEGITAPDRNDQYFLLQTIVGSWPMELTGPDYHGIDDYTERIVAYALKTVREAKVNTSWTATNQEYEDALDRYVRSLLSVRRSGTLVKLIEQFVRQVELPGAVNGVAAKLLALTVPGVPDSYQGTEWWDLSLVDPDNRRPVDFEARAAFLRNADFSVEGCTRALANWRRGDPKSLTVAAALRLRSRLPDVFAEGEYVPLKTAGTHADRVVAFLRRRQDEAVLVVAPRLVAPRLEGATVPLPHGWQDTVVEVGEVLEAGTSWKDEICGATHHPDPDQSLRVGELLKHFSVALSVLQ